ncbi:MAG TPA: O-acetyl-ADP-ribose deacetylase [Candidatus Nitrosotalea sp.]|nr:O-acetyl-ADP-ribose deacetylase [Candidatus Nitrosotalea sp.]
MDEPSAVWELEAQLTYFGRRLEVLVGNITEQRVDALVNAANSSLLGGGGVDGAMHKAAGPALLAACRRLRQTRYPQGLPTGEVAVTPPGDLPCRYVLHAVGPIYGREQGRESTLLASAYRRCLQEAAALGCDSIAFPAISTGAYRFPEALAATVCIKAMAEFFAHSPRPQLVRLVFFDHRAAQIFVSACGVDPDPEPGP